METLTILIGNSDDKLTQEEWSSYLMQVHKLVDGVDSQIHFAGYSGPQAPWQNACWVAEFRESDLPLINSELKAIAERFRQDSICILAGAYTTFVKP